MTLLIYVSRLMLLQSFSRRFACHAHIKALQYSVELRVSIPELPILGEYPLF